MEEEKQLTIAEKLNSNVFKVIGADSLIGFEKAFLIATAAKNLKTLLNNEYMLPIMELQGNKLGFKTDKDKEGGYGMAEVKNCLIEAVLTGVQPFGNQFNIIAGNCYITKEGFGYLLNNQKGLKYSIVPSLPRINADQTSAAIVMKIKWSLHGGPQQEQDLDIPVKMNRGMGTDAVIGKSTRKARAWLFNTVNGTEIADGDITEDAIYTDVSKKPQQTISKETMQNILPPMEDYSLSVKSEPAMVSNTSFIDADADAQKSKQVAKGKPKKEVKEEDMPADIFAAINNNEQLDKK